MKKFLLSAVFLCAAVLGFAKDKVIKIYTWNDEFEVIYGYSCREKMEKRGISTEFIVKPNHDGVYLTNLNNELEEGEVDIFLLEPDALVKYMNGEYATDIEVLGITKKDIENQYDFTKKFASDKNGKIKALTWQCCPGAFIYKRSIAYDVFGTDDPAKIQNLLKDWKSFENAAAECAGKGYKIISCPESTYHVFGSQMKEPWIVDGKVNIDASVRKWVEQAKMFVEEGYTEPVGQWSEAWFKDMRENTTLGFFGPGWFLDYVISPNAAETSGDWAVCMGPDGWYWGGSYVCVASNSKNKKEAAEILKMITCDEKTLEIIHKKQNDFVNNRKLMNKIAKSKDDEKEFLRGQNPYKYFCQSADSIKAVVADDYNISWQFESSMLDYIKGICTRKDAVKAFKKDVKKAGLR